MVCEKAADFVFSVPNSFIENSERDLENVNCDELILWSINPAVIYGWKVRWSYLVTTYVNKIC